MDALVRPHRQRDVWPACTEGRELLAPPEASECHIEFISRSIRLTKSIVQAWAQPWPGLVGTNVEISTGLFQDASGGWNGGDDSFYEYLIKVRLRTPPHERQLKIPFTVLCLRHIEIWPL